MTGKIAAVSAFLASLSVAPLAVGLSAAPGVGPVLVIVPPWCDGEALVARAGGRPLGPAAAPFALLAALPSPEVALALRAGGAWAVLDAAALATLCGVENA